MITKGEVNKRDALWQRWSLDGSTEVKHMLFDEYADWMIRQAKSIYHKYNVDNCDIEDYIHFASVALLESIERYNVESKIPFEPFAIKRLKGEILDNVSTFNEVANGHAQIRKYESTKFISLINNGKKNPTEAIIELTIDLYLIELLDNQSFFSDKKIAHTPYDCTEFEQLKDELKQIVDGLSKNHKIVIQYHYYYQWSFVEISERLGVTKGRVTQLHQEAIKLLNRAYFNNTR